MSADNAIIVMEYHGEWFIWHELSVHRNRFKPPKNAVAYKIKTQAIAYANGLRDGIGLVEYGIIVVESSISDT
jgi:hypothetical protein